MAVLRWYMDYRGSVALGGPTDGRSASYVAHVDPERGWPVWELCVVEA